MSDELRSVVRGVLSRHSDASAVWRVLAQQVGVAGLAIPSRYGGAGASLVEAHVALEELGRTLLPHPLLSCVVAGQALLMTGSEDACQRLLPRLVAGEVIAVGWPDEPILDADVASVLLLVDGDGSLTEVEGSVTPLATMDQSRRLGRLEVKRGTRIGTVDSERLRDIACVALSAEQVGTAAKALELTVDYLKTRVQFGRPIASFQAIQHRLADLHVMVESARAVSYAAVRGRTPAGVAKVYCSEVLAQVAAEMIQLHGGIGITWEHDAHRFFKRAHSAWHLFGPPREHLRRLEHRLSSRA
ncbi:MAG TPA: acyl-CoA dehydrogenase family protein [Candidatus Limnocylindrales bacterium]|nr:acyl-CoA dehydrogenase family protein [Candidatus Limnocylindrales bacterium]